MTTVLEVCDSFASTLCISLLPTMLWHRVVIFLAMSARDCRRFIGRAYVHVAGECVVQDVCVAM